VTGVELVAGGIGAAGLASAAVGWGAFRRKGLHRWLGEYIRTRHLRRDRRADEPIEVLFAVCDHYEPLRGGVSIAKGRQRVQQWVDEYPKLFERFRDSAGQPPQHTFFYPEDEYERGPELVDRVAELCRKGYGDVDIHLHHDNDTAEELERKLTNFKHALHDRHGLLARDPTTNEISYGFIHGNWCLNNSRADGRHCGVNDEIAVLLKTGCYADFTMPSAPSETQTRTINSIYWAVGDPNRPKAHNTGIPVGVGPKPPNSLLMVQGPLVLDWSRRKWGVIPAIENGNLQKNQPFSQKRIGLWLRASVKIPLLDHSVFVKLHTHGLNEPNQDVLLGREMVELHEEFQRLTRETSQFTLRYVTARQMADRIIEAVNAKVALHGAESRK
jgi:hypothetical protein